MKKINKLMIILASAAISSVSISMAADDTDAFLNSLLGEDTTTGTDISGSNDTALSGENIPEDLTGEDVSTQTEDTGSQSTTTVAADDSHGVALTEPKADLVKKADGNYLDVKWDVDSTYRPMLFVTKDGKQYFGDTLDKASNLKLIDAGTYKLSFQVKQNGEYVEAFTKTVESKKVDTKAMSNVKVGPETDLMIFGIVIMAIGYAVYRSRAYVAVRK